MFKKIFLRTRKFGGAQKKFGKVLPPNAPRGYGPGLSVKAGE